MADINAAFGNNLNPALTTPQGQLASSEAAVIGDSFAVFAWFCNMVDPAYSVGRMQDAIGRIYFIKRIAGEPTVQPCVCAGLDGTTVPNGALAQDPAGNLWVAQANGTIAAGSVTLNFACATNGPTPGPPSLIIYQAVFGLESITPTGPAALGRLVETPAQFEARRAASTGINSLGPLNAILAAVLQVPGVLDALALENDNSTSQTVGGVLLLANSIFISVVGGSDAAVAFAIWSRKAPGCNYSGNTTVVITDPNPAYQPPAPTYNVSFGRPPLVPFAVVVTLKNSSQVPSDALTLVQNAVIAAFAGLDGGPRAKIGSLVYASRYYAPVAALGNTYNGTTGQVTPGWSAPIVSIQLGVDAAAATITGTINGTTLAVSAVSSGTVAVGDLVEGSGVAPGTIINALAGGTGLTGNYLVNLSQTTGTASQTMNLTALLNDVPLNALQAPVVSAANIYLNLV
jgi:hypothetical protein